MTNPELSRVPLLLLIMPLVQSLVSCSGDSSEFEENVSVQALDVASIGIDAAYTVKPLTMSPGESLPIQIQATDSQGSEVSIEFGNRRWSVSDPSVASVSDAGRLIARNEGVADIALLFGALRSNVLTVTVADETLVDIESVVSVDDTDETATLDPCVAEDFYAVGRYSAGSLRRLWAVEWSVADEQRLTLEAGSDGLASLVARAAGEVSVTASSDEISATLDIPVTDSLTDIAIRPESPSVADGSSVDLTALGSYVGTTAETSLQRDITDAVSWEVTSGSAYASIDESGTLTGSDVGTAVVRASCGETVSASASVVVGEADLVNSSGLSFSVGGPINLSVDGDPQALRVATGASYLAANDVTEDVDWAFISNDGVASLEGENSDTVLIYPESEGTTVLRASYVDADDDEVVEDIRIIVD